jgi:hypothetical protein
MEEDRGAFKTNPPQWGGFDHFVKARKPRFFTGLTPPGRQRASSGAERNRAAQGGVARSAARPFEASKRVENLSRFNEHRTTIALFFDDADSSKVQADLTFASAPPRVSKANVKAKAAPDPGIC